MANLNLNKVVLGGRLTADVELKQTMSGISACTFTIAVNRRYSKDGEQECDFINCQAWRQTAEFVSRHFRKGSSICVTGAIQTRSWTDNNGQKRYATEVNVDEAMFVDSKNEAQQAEPASPAPYNPYRSNPQQEPKFEPISAEDQQLPF